MGEVYAQQNSIQVLCRLVSGQLDAWLWRNRDFPTEDDDLENCGLEVCRTATIKPRKIERSGFFLLDHNGQTWIYRLVSGQSDGRLWRNRDFPTKDDVRVKMIPITYWLIDSHKMVIYITSILAIFQFCPWMSLIWPYYGNKYSQYLFYLKEHRKFRSHGKTVSKTHARVRSYSHGKNISFLCIVKLQS